MVTDSVFHEGECIDCQTVVVFSGMPSDAECPNCHLRM
jgi:hypothetical protein